MNRKAFYGALAATALVSAPFAGIACGGGGDIGLSTSSGSGSGSGEGGSGGAGGMATSSGGAGGGGGIAGECEAAPDCDSLHGPAPCGAWACTSGACEAQSPGCVDADQDGYGSGAGCACAGVDCDDNDEKILGSASRSCYSGPAGTDGKGTCLAGLEACSNGVWSPCVGEVTPSGEACNNLDDDCNGAADDNLGDFSCGLGACAKTVPACANGVVGICQPGPSGGPVDGPMCDTIDNDCDGAVDEDCAMCVPVSLAGNDQTADGSKLFPFQTIQAAIDWTVANNGPTTVCVAAGPFCGTQANPVQGIYTIPGGTITMADGISVLGNYEFAAFTRCTSFTTTVIQPGTPEGVMFPSGITKLTVLDGFRVDRFNAATTAAITVDGAKNVILSGLQISNAPAVTNSYGINLINGAEATITRGRIDAGAGSGESIGVRSVGSRVKIENNCASIDNAGHCDDFCAGNPSIRGRTMGPGVGVTHAVLLQNSPNSSIETSALCANEADQGSPIRIAGDAKGVLIRGNLVNGFGGSQHSHGIWMEDCGGAAPWIVDNERIAATGDTQQTLVDAVRAIGDCHPVIDSNELISGGGEGNAANTTAVHCGANGGGVASKCVVLGNPNIRGSETQFPPSAVGVRCDNGGCNKIAGNTITGRGGVESYGVYLEKTGAVVDNNVIRGGCASMATAGVFATDAFSRVQNNRIFGFVAADCGGGNPPQMAQSYGMRILTGAGVNEIDVHSNVIDGGGVNGQCRSRAVALDVTAQPPASGVGIFRNNILRAGLCQMVKAGFVEAAAAADPRIFEGNNFDPAGAPMALYIDETATALATPGEVDALLDMVVSGTLSADPMFVNYPTDLHIMAGSPCDGTGTLNGAPLFDMDGDPRDPAAPSIGADEP